MKKKLIVTGVIVCFGIAKILAQSCCGNPGLVTNGESILNFTTLCKKQIVLDINGDYTRFKPADHQSNMSDSVHDHHNHNSASSNTMVHSTLQSILISTLQVRYGIHDRITLQTQLPFWIVNTSQKHAFILGDVPLWATFRITQTDNYGLALSTGIDLPTGSNYVVFDNNYIISGTGSLDPILGMSFWFRHKKLITRLQTQYKQGMKGFDNIHFGSNLNTQCIFAYYLKEVDTQNKFNVNFSTGLNQDWTDAHALNGKFIDNTGGFILWYSAGTQVRYKKCLIPISFTVPVYTQLRGMQNEPNFRVRAGLTLLF